jgi:hypothetical protein
VAWCLIKHGGNFTFTFVSNCKFADYTCIEAPMDNMQSLLLDDIL